MRRYSINLGFWLSNTKKYGHLGNIFSGDTKMNVLGVAANAIVAANDATYIAYVARSMCLASL